MSRPIILPSGRQATLHRRQEELYFVVVGLPRPLSDGYAEGRLFQSGASSSFFIGPAKSGEAYALIQDDDGMLYVETTNERAYRSFNSGQTWEVAFAPDDEAASPARLGAKIQRAGLAAFADRRGHLRKGKLSDLSVLQGVGAA